MIAAAQLFNPGTVGFVAGIALIVSAAGLLVCAFSGRRVRAEVHAEVGRSGPPPGYWHPSLDPQRRPGDATQLFARCSDDLDATMVHPSVPRPRQASR